MQRITHKNILFTYKTGLATDQSWRKKVLEDVTGQKGLNRKVSSWFDAWLSKKKTRPGTVISTLRFNCLLKSNHHCMDTSKEWTSNRWLNINAPFCLTTNSGDPIKTFPDIKITRFSSASDQIPYRSPSGPNWHD